MKKLLIILSALFTITMFTSCLTVKSIPEDLSAAQLIQLGQNAYGLKQYENAEKYFITTIERYGENTRIYIEAQYELGHIYLTKKDYRKAYYSFKNILEIYEYSSGLPGSYKKLCNIEMAKIPEAKLKEFTKMPDSENGE